MCYTTGVRQPDGRSLGIGAASPAPGAAPVLIALAIWLAAACAIGAAGWLATLKPPGPQLVLVGLTIVLLAATRLWPPLRGRAADVRLFVLSHVTRLVGFYFLVLHARGELPWAFAVPGGWGDNVVAIGALVLVLFVRPRHKGRPPPLSGLERPRARRHPRGGGHRGPPHARRPGIDAGPARSSPLASPHVRRPDHHRHPRRVVRTPLAGRGSSSTRVTGFNGAADSRALAASAPSVPAHPWHAGSRLG